MNEMSESDRAWVKALWARARNPHDPAGYPQCFGIAQLATLGSHGLRYNEGRADSKITHKKDQRHAWNTLDDGHVVDLTMTVFADGSTGTGEDAYENYRAEHSPPIVRRWI